MKKLGLAAVALVSSAQMSAAATGSCVTNPLIACVPEISAMEGAAAIAAMAAVVLLVWERRRRAS